MTHERVEEMIAAASVCVSERDVSRRLVAAIRAADPAMADAAAAARKAGPRSVDAIRVWAWLDREHGPAITRAALERARA